MNSLQLKKYFSFFLTFILFSNVYSQENTDFKILLSSEARALVEFSSQFDSSNADSVLQVIESIHSRSDSTELAILRYYKGKLNAILKYDKDALASYNSVSQAYLPKLLKASYYYDYAVSLRILSNYTKSLQLLDSSDLHIPQSLDTTLQSHIILLRGNNNYYQGNLNSALSYWKIAHNSFIENKLYKEAVYLRFNIAATNLDSRNYLKAAQEFSELEKEFEEHSINRMNLVYMNWADALRHINPDSALHVLHKFESNQDRELTKFYNLEAAIFLNLGENDKAINSVEKSIEIALRLGMTDEEKYAIGTKCKVLLQKGEYKKCLKCLSTINDYFIKGESLLSKHDYLETYLHARHNNLFSDTLFRTYLELSDGLKNDELQFSINEALTDIKIEQEKRESELEKNLLSAEVQTKNTTIRSQRLFTLVLILGLCLLAAAWYISRQNRLNAEEKAIHLEELKILKEQEAEFLKEENNRLLESNMGLSDRIELLSNDPKAILNETWVINPTGRKQITVKLGDILAINSAPGKANNLEYVISQSDYRPEERRTMKDLLNDPNFSLDIYKQVHQSHIVNLYSIASIDKKSRKVYLKGFDEPISISEPNLAELLEVFKALKTQ